MKKKNIKSVVYLVGFFAMIAVLGTLYSFTTASITPYSGPEKGKWQNLKVLPQDISEDSLYGLMHEYERALGVKCAFCHAPRKDGKISDFASDKLVQKEIARGMIVMTDEINEKYFEPHRDAKYNLTAVRCVLCHRGTHNPEKYLQDIELYYDHQEKGGYYDNLFKND